MKWLLVPVITILGMWGGQQMKWVRRWGIPAVPVLWRSLKQQKKKKKKFKYLVLLALIPLLSMGYGESSTLRGWLGGSDTWTRIVLGILMGLPFLVFELWYAPLVMSAAYSVRAGSIGQIGGYDILIEDMVRYGSLGVLIAVIL